jgi:hypothetical protein
MTDWVIVTGADRSTWRRIGPNATLSSINPIRTGLTLNPVLCTDRLTTNCLKRKFGVVDVKVTTFVYDRTKHSIQLILLFTYFIIVLLVFHSKNYELLTVSLNKP